MSSPASSRSPLSEPLRRPAELDLLDLGRSAVIEASAGTGKTYLLEHLVLELLITGRARIEEILIVTFTERATAELVTRIRTKINEALATATPAATQASGWLLDATGRARLVEARASFDQAAISTIHSFCQGILTDEPMATGRLLGQTQVDGRQAFGEAFRDCLRRTLTTEAAHRAYLDAYLATGRSVEALEELLYRTATARGTWARAFDEDALRDVTERLTRLDPDAVDLDGALRDAGIHYQTSGAVCRALKSLVPVAQAALTTSEWGLMLAAFDAKDDLFPRLEKVAALRDVAPRAVAVTEFARRALDAAPPLDEAIAQLFAPLVESRLRARKLADGLYDYDDMIRAVDEAIDSERGSALVDKLRRRYRFALVDEAQDTEPAQWRIFRRIFLESDLPHPVVLIGDPKQAIYGFRGADVRTYVQAREDIRARQGVVLALARNYRSHPEVIAATNAILDHQANPRYFTGDDITYDHPVTAAKAALGTGPGITLFTVELPAEQGKPARIGTIKRTLQEAIGAAIARLRSAVHATALSRIFVLVRTNAEAREIAEHLHRAGLPNVLFRPDDIYKSAEATHVRALLLAIADPTDRAARLAAWLTPFFDVSLDQLANATDLPPGHPLMARLASWKALADARAFDDLWARLLDDSGVARRLRLSAAGLRRLTNYRHLFDFLHAQSSARPQSITDLAALLGAYAAGHRRSASADDTDQRLETEDDAIRIMTIHAAKGLEADVVFVYGGLTAPWFWRGIHTLHRAGGRLRCAGKPRRTETIDLIRTAQYEEDQRLLYVAITRARTHLYLPFFPAVEPGELDAQGERAGGDFDPFSRVTGPYRHVNQRLRALVAEPARAGVFRMQAVGPTGATARDEESILAELAAWSPASDAAGESDGDRNRAAFAAVRARRRGFAMTSYSRLSAAHGAFQTGDAPAAWSTSADPDGDDLLGLVDARAAALVDPVESLNVEFAPRRAQDPTDDDPTANPADNPDDEAAEARAGLPGGIASGLFLHAILEKVPLGDLPPLELWRESPDLRHLIESESRRWDREPRHFAQTARLVHAALTVPIPMPDGSILPGVAAAARVRREVDFLFPLPLPTGASPGLTSPEDRMVHERGFVRGSLDVLFEHHGRVCFADWKSNALPNFSRAAVRAHVTAHYDLQVRIYTLALVRMLGIDNGADYERRFGGVVYLFLRGLGPLPPARADRARDASASDDGLYVHRPSYAEVERWNHDLAATLVAGAGDHP